MFLAMYALYCTVVYTETWNAYELLDVWLLDKSTRNPVEADFYVWLWQWFYRI